MWGERDHRKEWVGEGSQVVSSRGHNKFTSRSHRPFRKVHACAWGDGETRTAFTGEISLLDCVLCMGQSFPISGKEMQVLVLVLISGHVVVSHVKTQFSWEVIYIHVIVFERIWHFKFQMLVECVCICWIPSSLVCKSFWTTHLCIILEMDACCHSAGSWGGCWFFSGYFWPGKSVHWNCAWASCEKELWWSTSPPRMRLILFPQFQKVLNCPNP